MWMPLLALTALALAPVAYGQGLGEQCAQVGTNTQRRQKVGERGIVTPSWGECARKCSQQADCSYWTWHTDDDEAFKNRCSLMSNYGSATADPNTITGDRACQSDDDRTGEQCALVGTNTQDRYKVGERGIVTPSWGECAKECSQQADCSYWTWHTDDDEAWKNRCSLMSSYGSATADPNTITGHRACQSDDDRTEEVCTKSSEPVLDLVFVIDSSGSINAVGDKCEIDADLRAMIPENRLPDSCRPSQENYQFMKDFIKKIVKDLTIGPDNVRVGLVLFSAKVQHLFYLNTYTTKEEIYNAINNMPYLGQSTSTRLALEAAHHEQLENKQNGDREMVPDLVIVLTDGESNYGTGDTKGSDMVEVLRISEHMHEDGVNIIAVGVTSFVNQAELKGISSPDHVENKNWFFIKKFSGLPDMVPTIMKETCKVIPPEPPAPTDPPAPTEKPADICIPKTKVYGTNLRFTLTDGNNFATVADREGCLDLCDQYDLCASIEFNIGFSKCQLNKRLIGDDVTGIHARWEYCPRRTPIPNPEK